MSAFVNRTFKVPEALTEAIDRCLRSYFSTSLNESKRIADCILKMSDFYIDTPEAKTPWDEKWCQIAQLAYHLPLNTLRLQSVVLEAERQNFFQGLDEVYDFGAGLGAVQWALAANKISFKELTTWVERSSTACSLSRKMGLEFAVSDYMKPDASSKTLATCSFSFTESRGLPDWVSRFERLLIVEPATRSDGRRLLEARKSLIEQGFSIWAPCLHQEACPLLTLTQNDWCHDRIHFDRPDWMKGIEAHLPFENATLTYSYLLAGKTPPPAHPKNWVRTTGDLLVEKGKSRQMICQGPQREYFSWMQRNGPPQEIPRGVVCELPEHFDRKSNELRLSSPASIVLTAPQR